MDISCCVCVCVLLPLMNWFYLIHRRQQKKKTQSAVIQVQYKPDVQTNHLSIDNPIIDADDPSIVYLPVGMCVHVCMCSHYFLVY